MDFPHLSDTKFPMIDNVNVYKYQNNFDYARWTGKVSIKMLNVLWNSNYADVPYFNTVEERDEWFNEQAGFVGTLESLFNSTPENTIKVPVPYNDAYKYNYLVVDMPIQTSEQDKINYENENHRVNRWFYFIDDMQQLSPSTTELKITVDYWTTFIHSVNIPYLMLERGHAPMFKTSVEEYLNNPIENNEYLLADDFNFGNETVIQTSNYVPVGNGKKYVLFVAPISISGFSAIGGTKYSGNSTPPTYEDTDARWGYQFNVNGYEWKYGYTDYSNARLPIGELSQDGTLNGCACYAIDSVSAQAFFNEIATYHVNLVHAIQAMFILDETLFTKQTEFTYEGYTLYSVSMNNKELDFNFTKEQFGFDSKYENITKLYTFPYSSLEITDDEGSVFSAKIENCGNVKMHEEVSLIYPFLNYNVFMSGINGNGTMQYKWKNINNSETTKSMYASDFSKFMMNWEIPTYSIYVSSQCEYAANNAAGVAAKRAGAIKDYKNSVRFGNTTRENTADSFSTNTSNVAATGQTNTINTKANGDRAITNRGVQNSANTDITNESNQTLYDNTTSAMTNNSNLIMVSNNKLEADRDTDNDGTAVLTQISNAVTNMTTGVNMTANIITGGMAAASSGSPVGALTGLISVGINAATMGANTTLMVGGANAASTIVQTVNRDKTTHATNANTDTGVYVRQYMREQSNNNIDCNAANTATQNEASRIQTQNEAITNNGNAERTQTTDNANAQRTQTTETNNATYTRNANVDAEKGNLVQKQLEAESAYKNAMLQKPTTYSNYSGDFMPDAYKRRGVRFNIRTQSKSAIAQAGDAMLRFGYAIHRVWDMSSGFHYGKEFTFWKAEDVWINDGSGVANIATEVIGSVLMKGVTVWRNPEKIGTVGIYNNI